ncbi:IclR family transcriptional regulator [Kineococcus sp. SYSU DK006]|uniref:IclR family transcriptional regulator n=1 Tax=Kineococcus sp. SYSU DK006 TaxID=3383127 RepID=UPI003D7DC374
MSASLGRALGLLDLVAAGTCTLGGLAAASGTHKSTVLRQLRVLEDAGYVHHDDQHRYVLGAHLFRLAQQALDSFDVRTAAAPRLRRLRDAVGRTVHLAVLDPRPGAGCVYVDELEPAGAPVRTVSRIGGTAPLHRTAVGKVLLAGLPPAERERLVRALPVPASAARTTTDPDALLAEVAEVAERGWAQERAEDGSFVNCVAAPVHGADGRVRAAVSISVPDVLLPHEALLALVPTLTSATADISRDCGYDTPGGTSP